MAGRATRTRPFPGYDSLFLSSIQLKRIIATATSPTRVRCRVSSLHVEVVLPMYCPSDAAKPTATNMRRRNPNTESQSQTRLFIPASSAAARPPKTPKLPYFH